METGAPGIPAGLVHEAGCEDEGYQPGCAALPRAGGSGVLARLGLREATEAAGLSWGTSITCRIAANPGMDGEGVAVPTVLSCLPAKKARKTHVLELL